MMTAEQQNKLKRSLVLHEEKRNFPYVDTEGKISIGIGYNLTDRGLSDEWITKQYNDDVSYFYNALYENFSWFKELNNDRQIVLIDMCFMGFKKFCGFTRMIKALSQHDYLIAAHEMLDSAWAKQVKTRADVLAKAMVDGVYEI
jgi:lysozyme